MEENPHKPSTNQTAKMSSEVNVIADENRDQVDNRY